MFEEVRQMMERETGQQMSSVLRQVFEQRLKVRTGFLMTMVTALLGLILSIVVVVWSVPKGYQIVTFVLMNLILAILITGEFLRTNEGVVANLAGYLWKVIVRKRRQKATDFLAGHFQVCLVLIVAPLAVFVFLCAINWSDRAPLPVDAIVTLAGWLLPAQIALFSFLFSHTLGKYSSQMARVIITHRTVSLLQGCGLFALCFSLSLKHYGCPRLCFDWIWLFYMSLFVCLIMTIIVARKGVDTNLFVLYVGHHYARQLRRRIKRPIMKQSPWAIRFWHIAGILGLDFRSLGRFSVISESGGSGELCKRRLMSLFNAAMKTVGDNQHESLQSCLFSIILVMNTYATQRAEYLSSTDSVYSYCNDQFSALINAAAKSPNEHLAEEIVMAIGMVGQSSFKIKGLVGEMYELETPQRHEREHSLSSYWFSLLQEAFGRLCLLQRSGAPGEVLQQLLQLAVSADTTGFPKIVVYSYFPAIENIIDLCIKHRSPYHQSLIARSLRDVIIVWRRNLGQHHDYLRDHEGVHHGAIELIRKAIESGVATRLPVLLMAHIPEALSYQIQPGAPIVQDVFMSLVGRTIKDIHGQRDTVGGMKDVITLVSDLAVHFAKDGNFGANYFLEALYEFSFIVFQKLPPTFDPMHDPVYDNYPEEIRNSLALRQKENPRLPLEEALFKAWRKVMPAMYEAKHNLVHGWEQFFFSFIGLAICIHAQRKEKWLTSGIQLCAGDYLSFVKKEFQVSNLTRLKNGNHEYLQLCGAWIDRLIDLPDLSKEMLETVAVLRCIDRPFDGDLGYPTLVASSGDFYLSPLRSIRDYISCDDLNIHKSYEATLMANDVLFSYYKKVQATKDRIKSGELTIGLSVDNSNTKSRNIVDPLPEDDDEADDRMMR